MIGAGVVGVVSDSEILYEMNINNSQVKHAICLVISLSRSDGPAANI